MSDVTRLLREWSAGSAEAREQLLALVYDPLREIAERHFAREREGHTLQPTALVNELYLRFGKQRHVDWQSREQFFGVAAHVMRRILVDHARRRKSDKRAGEQVPLTIAGDIGAETDIDVIALDLAMERLETIYPQQARVVELRFFGGLTLDETATALGVSAATISREWAMARAWLRRAMTA